VQTLTEKILKLRPIGGLFDSTEVDVLFPNVTLAAKKSLLNKALRKGEIVRLAPGNYSLSHDLGKQNSHSFAIALRICGPSYLTMESALSYHDMIPESVHQFACGITGRSRSYTNFFGRFDYYRILCNPFMADVFSVKLNEMDWGFIAGPVRAIADIIYTRKNIDCKGNCLAFLLDSLRIELEDIEKIPANDFDLVISSFNNYRVKKFLDSVRKDIYR